MSDQSHKTEQVQERTPALKVPLQMQFNSASQGQSSELLSSIAGLSSAPIQMSEGSADPGEGIHSIAAQGLAGPGGPIPHQEKIQASFGSFDISGAEAHQGGAAQEANEQMGARGYATEGAIVLKDGDLHTTAHELTHHLHQRQGVQLKGQRGEPGDRYEHHADAVADAVVAGRSAEPLLSGFGLSPAAGGGASGALQMDLIDSAIELGQSVVETVTDLGERAYDAVTEWIDLMGAKTELLAKISDTTWVRESVSDVKADAHKKHNFSLKFEMELLIAMCRVEAMAKAHKIAGCDSLEQLKTLDAEVAEWQKERKQSFKKEVETKVQEYRDVELEWLSAYTGHAALEKKKVVPNDYAFGAKSDIKLLPGAASQVIYTTPVEFEWLLTDGAKKANTKAKTDKKKAPVPAWNAKTKKTFKEKIQAQLDAVWGSGNGMKPFKITEPSDHLLADEASKWSSIVASFRGVVEERAGQTGNNKIKAWRSAPGEPTRADSGNLYEEDAEADFNKDGSAKGGQHVMAHEFGHFGMGLPDEYTETSKGSNKAAFDKAIVSIDKKIKECDAIIAKNSGNTPEEKKARKKAQDDKQWYLDDKTALNSPWGTGVAGGLGWNMMRLAPQNRPAGIMPIPEEAFAGYGGDNYGPGLRKLRGQRPNMHQTSDRQRIMIWGNKVEPYMYEGILELLNQLVQSQFDPEVKFEHNVAAGSDEKKVIDDVRAWNIEVDMGKAKAAKGGARAPGDEKAATPP